jgi:hypothetical protein
MQKFYVWESVNCSAVGFSTFAQAHAFYCTLPLRDLRGNADSVDNYAEYSGWTCGSAAQMLAELNGHAEFATAQEVAQRYKDSAAYYA